MESSYASYIKRGADVKVTCIVEYVNNAKDWERVCGGKEAAPWGCYKERKFDDIGKAVEFYLVKFFRMVETEENEDTPIWDRIYDVKFWLNVEENNDLICEHYIELPHSVVYHLRQTFGVEQAREFYKLQEKAERQEKLLNAYSEFLEQFGAGKRFEEFLRQKQKENNGEEYLPYYYEMSLL